MQECWLEDPTKRPTAHEILSRLAPKLPMDSRPIESTEIIPSARFRDSVGRGIGILSLKDLEAILSGTGSQGSALFETTEMARGVCLPVNAKEEPHKSLSS